MKLAVSAVNYTIASPNWRRTSRPWGRILIAPHKPITTRLERSRSGSLFPQGECARRALLWPKIFRNSRCWNARHVPCRRQHWQNKRISVTREGTMRGMENLSDALVHRPGSKSSLRKFDADETHGFDKPEAVERLRKNVDRLSLLQYRLYAEAKRSVLVVLQGIDAAGKDGVIRHVISGLNPQGVTVTPFKVPEGEER